MSRQGTFRRNLLRVLATCGFLLLADLALRPILDRLCSTCTVPLQFTKHFSPRFVWEPASVLPKEHLAEIQKTLAAWEKPPASDDPIRILVLGDRVTARDELDARGTFPERLSARIGDRGERPGVEILNYSVPGYSTFQIYRLAESGLGMATFDAIIIAAGVADHQPSERADASWIHYRLGRAGSWRTLMENSGWYRLLRPRPGILKNGVPRVSRAERELLLERLQKIASSQGIFVGFTPTDFLEKDSETVAAVARAVGIPTVDFMPELKRHEISLNTIRSYSLDPEENHYRYTEYLLVHHTQADVEATRRKLVEETGLGTPDSDEIGLFLTRERLNHYGHELLARLWERRLTPTLLQDLQNSRQGNVHRGQDYLPGGVPVLTPEEIGTIGKLPEPPR